jgi:hypothetical protein
MASSPVQGIHGFSPVLPMGGLPRPATPPDAATERFESLVGRLEGFQAARTMQKQSDEHHISALLKAVLELSRKVQRLEAMQDQGMIKEDRLRGLEARVQQAEASIDEHWIVAAQQTAKVSGYMGCWLQYMAVQCM